MKIETFAKKITNESPYLENQKLCDLINQIQQIANLKGYKLTMGLTQTMTGSWYHIEIKQPRAKGFLYEIIFGKDIIEGQDPSIKYPAMELSQSSLSGTLFGPQQWYSKENIYTPFEIILQNL
jgi:hypothetical protein